MVHCQSVEENLNSELYKSPEMVSIELCNIAINKDRTTSTLNNGLPGARGGYEKSYARFLSSLSEEQRDQLYPRNEQSRRKHEEILRRFNSCIVPFFNTTVMTSNPREGLDLFIESLSLIENLLVSCRTPYFSGSEPLFLDFGIFPIIDKIGKWTVKLPDFELPHLMRWRALMRAHPYVVAMTSLSSEDEASDKRSYIRQLRSGNY